MPADAYVMDADMKKVADAIRAKAGTTEPLVFPDGMVNAVNGIQTGGKGGIVFLNEHCRITGRKGGSSRGSTKNVSYISNEKSYYFDKNFSRIFRDEELNNWAYIGATPSATIIKSPSITFQGTNINKFEISKLLYDAMMNYNLPPSRGFAVYYGVPYSRGILYGSSIQIAKVGGVLKFRRSPSNQTLGKILQDSWGTIIPICKIETQNATINAEYNGPVEILKE